MLILVKSGRPTDPLALSGLLFITLFAVVPMMFVMALLAVAKRRLVGPFAIVCYVTMAMGIGIGSLIPRSIPGAGLAGWMMWFPTGFGILWLAGRALIQQVRTRR